MKYIQIIWVDELEKWFRYNSEDSDDFLNDKELLQLFPHGYCDYSIIVLSCGTIFQDTYNNKNVGTIYVNKINNTITRDKGLELNILILEETKYRYNIEISDKLRKRLGNICNRNLWEVEMVIVDFIIENEDKFIWDCEYKGLKFEVYYSKTTRETWSSNTFNIVMPWNIGYKIELAQVRDNS